MCRPGSWRRSHWTALADCVSSLTTLCLTCCSMAAQLTHRSVRQPSRGLSQPSHGLSQPSRGLWLESAKPWLEADWMIRSSMYAALLGRILPFYSQHFVPSVLWCCWLGGRKGIRPVKKLAWLSVWSKVQTCIWPSWCHCHSLSLVCVCTVNTLLSDLSVYCRHSRKRKYADTVGTVPVPWDFPFHC